MSSKSGIQWTDATWNPITGCTRVSSGCNFCYAFQLHDMRYKAWKDGRYPAHKPAPAQYHRPFSADWKDPATGKPQGVQVFPERLSEPLRWRKPRRVFVDSMSDLFHEQVSGEFIRRVFKVMGEARQHTFQVLTKRPERMQRIVSEMAREGDFATLTGRTEPAFPWPNVWLGVSVENQAAADERIPLLLQTPAAVRFLSCEPLLGPVNLWTPTPARYDTYGQATISWCIIGGESGPHARPMQLDWAQSLVEQCHAAGVAPFVKQLGQVWAKSNRCHERHAGDPDEWPEALRVREFPMVAAVGVAR